MLFRTHAQNGAQSWGVKQSNNATKPHSTHTHTHPHTHTHTSTQNG